MWGDAAAPSVHGHGRSSSEQARQMDEVQYRFDDGPCLRATREGYTVHIPDFVTDTQFPEYREAIAHHGMRSALGVPIRLEEGTNAGLDFYSTKAHAFTDKSIEVAESFARYVPFVAARCAYRVVE